MKRLILTMFLCLAVSGAAYAEALPAERGDRALSVRTFQFKHKDASAAAAVIKPLLSAAGTMSIQPSTNSLVVTDRAENMKAIVAALDQFDTAGRPIRMTIRLVAASRSDNPPAPPADLRDIAGKLAIIRYNQIESLGEAVVEGREGEPGSVELGTGYRADFRFSEIDPATDSVKLNDFKLSRLQKDQLSPLFGTTLNVKMGQTLMFGVTKTQGPRALFLVFVARP